LIRNRIAWGKSYLKKGGFVHYPERGMVQITKKGKDASNRKIKLKDVESYFLNFYTEEKTKTTDNNKIKGSSPQDLIDYGFSAIELQIKNELLERLKDIDPYYFEKVILILLKKMGYGDFIETSKSNDGGIDGIINEDKLGLEKIYIQAKRYNENKVREKNIRNFIGAMSGDTNKGVFVTASTFDDTAIEKAHDAHHSIILIDGKNSLILCINMASVFKFVMCMKSRRWMKTFLKEIDQQIVKRRRKYKFSCFKQNNGIQRIAKNVRPLMPGVRQETKGSFICLPFRCFSGLSSGCIMRLVSMRLPFYKEQTMYPSVKEVRPHEDYTLSIVFENGEKGILTKNPPIGLQPLLISSVRRQTQRFAYGKAK